MLGIERFLLRLLQHLAALMVTILAAFVLLILLQYNTPDLTLTAALIALAAAALDFMGRRHGRQ